MLRMLDVLFAAIGLLLTAPLCLLLFLLGWRDTGSPIFRQERVGRYQRPFVLFKFRTMRVGTPSAATHLVGSHAVTRYGGFLRRTKLDELPQLWNVLRGDMSLVGPRPCLFSQTELIAARASHDVFRARPGVTGLAQVKGVDMSEPQRLAALDAEMLAQLSVATYLRFVTLTALGRGAGDRVRL